MRAYSKTSGSSKGIFLATMRGIFLGKRGNESVSRRFTLHDEEGDGEVRGCSVHG